MPTAMAFNNIDHTALKHAFIAKAVTYRSIREQENTVNGRVCNWWISFKTFVQIHAERTILVQSMILLYVFFSTRCVYASAGWYSTTFRSPNLARLDFSWKYNFYLMSISLPRVHSFCLCWLSRELVRSYFSYSFVWDAEPKKNPSKIKRRPIIVYLTNKNEWGKKTGKKNFSMWKKS